MPSKESKTVAAPPPKATSRTAPAVAPESCVHILQRTQGWSFQQATDYAAKLSDADQTKFTELAQLPHHGDSVRRLLGDVADRQLQEKEPR